MKKIAGRSVWALVSLTAAFFLAAIAVDRGEPVNSFWIVLAAACTYLVGFRFYARFIAAKVMALDDQRATPAERLRDGHDYEPTNKWILFGHHFAAIAGPGPLVGPTLAAQFGYLPSVYWIIIGAVLGGAVQDFVILFCSMRRDGKTLGQMAREEIGKTGGFTALLTVLFIMFILLAVVALVKASGEGHRGPPKRRRVRGQASDHSGGRFTALLTTTRSCWLLGFGVRSGAGL